MHKKDLAVVIPAYKSRFLSRTLDSLVCQTDKRFTVYLGDDNSPDDLRTIVNKYENLIDIKYFHFASNLGGKSLVRQWERCVALTHEHYIWMFSDDDVLPADAVERFWKFENNCDFDICRFNLQIVDENEKVIIDLGEHPVWQSSVDFLKERMEFATLSAASEYIFTRDAYKRYGFVEFPCAWCSDDASWIQMGQEKGIWTIKGLPVQMRMSGMNISSNKAYNEQKFAAVLCFCDWIQKHNLLSESKLYFLYVKAQIANLHLSFAKRLALAKVNNLSFFQKILIICNSKYIYKLFLGRK